MSYLSPIVMNKKKTLKKEKKIDYSVISEASLTKLARKAGVEAIGGLGAFQSMRSFISHNMDKILREAMKISEETTTKKTLSEDVLIRTIDKLDIKMFPIDEDDFYLESDSEDEKLEYKTYKKCKTKKNITQAKRTISFLQSQTKDCVYIPKAGFKRLVTSEAKLYPSAHDIKVTSAACLMLQVYIENMTIQLCRYANLVAIHAGRKTMSSKDISLTEKIARSQLHKDLKYDIDDPDRPPRINLFLD